MQVSIRILCDWFLWNHKYCGVEMNLGALEFFGVFFHSSELWA